MAPRVTHQILGAKTIRFWPNADMIDVSAVARHHGFERDFVAFEPQAWERAIAWDRPTQRMPDGALACDAEIIGRVGNVLRWMRPALRRGALYAKTEQFKADFVAYYAYQKHNPAFPGDKHCPQRVLFEGEHISPRRITIVLRETHGWR